MSTYAELVYMVLDEVKGMSDDFTYNEDHVIFLLNKFRGFILKQKYTDIRNVIPDSNYQTLKFNLIQVPAISGECCEGGTYLRSDIKIPQLLELGHTKVYPLDYYKGDIAFISKDRMKYVGHNKYLKNIIYCSINPDGYLYFKSSNPQFLYLEKAEINAIFQNPNDLTESSTTSTKLDGKFPLEDALIPLLIESVVKELVGTIYRPKDYLNNAYDNLEGLSLKTKQ